MAQVENPRAVTEKDLRWTFVRMYFLQTALNFERLEALGYAFILGPILKRFYAEKERLSAALKRHLEFFNTQPFLAAPIVGVTLALEEKIANDEPVSPEAITAVKTGLMGPLAGVGDSVFWFTLWPLYQAIGAGMLLQKNFLGSVFFFVFSNGTAALMYWYGVRMGYKQGISIVSEMKGQLQKLTTAMGVMGLMMVGAMAASLVKMTTPLHIVAGKQDIAVQALLDQISPNILPIGFTLFVYWIMNKKNVRPTYIIFGILALGIVSSYLKILK